MTKKDGVLYDVNERDLELLRENPEKFWKDVTVIGCCAFGKFDVGFASIKIPDSVKEIQDHAFGGMLDLTRVVLPKGLVKIGYGAFTTTGIEKLEIPDTVEYIGDYAFYFSELNKVNIPSNLKYVGKEAFTNSRVAPEIVEKFYEVTKNKKENVTTGREIEDDEREQ